jgi:hypothetical protein
MPTPLLLLRVATTWSLPGLGLLALPDGPTPHLATYPLHTALAVQAKSSHGPARHVVATVEEVTRPDAPTAPTYGLLLDFGDSIALPPGTEIWLADDDFRGAAR